MRARTCKVCKTKYQPQRPLQAVCSNYACALSHARNTQTKALRKQTRARKEGLRTKSDWLKLAQAEFNGYIRLRDADLNLGCISCGRFHHGQWHAGHYRPVGGLGAPYRFNEMNCHRQCAPCNNWKSGNLTEYRIELVKRVGVDIVEWLEQDREPLKLTIEEIKAVRGYYRKARKAMMLTAGESEPF